MSAKRPLSFASWLRRVRKPIVHWLWGIICTFVVAGYLGASLYGVWGWVTLSDIRKYCDQKKLDYQGTLDAMIIRTSDTNINIDDEGVKETNQLAPHTDEPILRWTVPFAFGPTAQFDKEGKLQWYVGAFRGALLEPFMGVSENTANGICSLALGCLISLVIVFVEALKEKPVGRKRLLLRPIAGAIGALCTYLIILSGGSLIWNQVAGVSGLSIGVISAIGSIYVEKLQKYATFTT